MRRGHGPAPGPVMVGRSGTEGQDAPRSVMSLLTGTSTHRCVPPTTPNQGFFLSVAPPEGRGELPFRGGCGAGWPGGPSSAFPKPDVCPRGWERGPWQRETTGAPRRAGHGEQLRELTRLAVPCSLVPGAWSGSGRSRGLTDGLLAKERVQTCVFGDVISESREMLPPRFSAPPPGTLGAAPTPAAAGSSAPGGTSRAQRMS